MKYQDELLDGLGFMIISYAFMNLIFAVINMFKDPYGVTRIIGFTNFSLHSYTIISLTVLWTILYMYFFRDMEQFRLLSSTLIMTIFPLFHYEFWFHLGMWLTWGDYNPLFWGLYTSVVFACVVYLKRRQWNILNFELKNLCVFIGCYGVFLGLWYTLIANGFYVDFVHWYRGDILQNPHGLWNAFGKVFSIFMWLPLMRKVKK